MNQVLKHELSIFISTMHIEIAQNCSKSSSCLTHFKTLLFSLVEPLTLLYFVPYPRVEEHSIRVLLCLSWGEREVYVVKQIGEVLK